ncbi:hypothetical protein RFI_21230 [Reticulomyxa filosa]|uniref:Uncharacterized protein n=1 Tax=Reticulomyxa filosa TaxID=46433 RepID=X6MRP7_RETFI|nr:hypothetical protein RFI_21230 [Reticulomyxa filosa]|eukprot:ETO16127.1 hypothetical protein RFI_21230 [Reticulomyxa filosa]
MHIHIHIFLSTLFFQDISKLFERVLSLELDGSLVTELPETANARTTELTMYVKGGSFGQDLYQKYSLPTTITQFKVSPVGSSCVVKGWNDSSAATSTSGSTTPSARFTRRQYRNEIGGATPDDDIKLDTNNKHKPAGPQYTGFNPQHQSTLRRENDAMFEDKKVVSNAPNSSSVSSDQFQSVGSAVEVSPNVEKKMTFKDKLQNSQKAAKKTSTLRIAGGTQ